MFKEIYVEFFTPVFFIDNIVYRFSEMHSKQTKYKNLVMGNRSTTDPLLV